MEDKNRLENAGFVCPRILSVSQAFCPVPEFCARNRAVKILDRYVVEFSYRSRILFFHEKGSVSEPIFVEVGSVVERSADLLQTWREIGRPSRMVVWDSARREVWPVVSGIGHVYTERGLVMVRLRSRVTEDEALSIGRVLYGRPVVDYSVEAVHGGCRSRHGKYVGQDGDVLILY